jgi:hypothetical protein
MVFIALFTAATFSVCGAQSRSATDDARELAGLIFTSRMFDVTMTQASSVGSQIVKANLEGRLKRSFSSGEAERLRTIVERVVRQVTSKADWEAIYADLLSQYYSPVELGELLAFHRTPLGAKMARLWPVLTAEGSARGEALMKSREGKFGELFIADFVREFPALRRELERP